jgi:REP element-mobilizing transposase RayT
MEHEITILSGKVASDHIHVLVAHRAHVDVSLIVQWLKGISSRILLQELAHLRKAFFLTGLRSTGYDPTHGFERVEIAGRWLARLRRLMCGPALLI